MLETLRAGRAHGYLRSGIDLDTLAERLCQTMLHISLGVFRDVRGAEQLPAIRCRILLEGVAVRSASGPRARPVECVPGRSAGHRLLGQGRRGRGRSGHTCFGPSPGRSSAGGATRPRPSGTSPRPPDLSTGSVYRMIGSKEELLASIMGAFPAAVRTGWRTVLGSDASSVEKLDALMWININVVDRFSDEYNIQLAWLRESPPSTSNLGQHFPALLRDLKGLLANGARSGDAPHRRARRRHPGVVVVRSAVDAREHRAQGRRPRRTHARARASYAAPPAAPDRASVSGAPPSLRPEGQRWPAAPDPYGASLAAVGEARDPPPAGRAGPAGGELPSSMTAGVEPDGVTGERGRVRQRPGEPTREAFGRPGQAQDEVAGADRAPRAARRTGRPGRRSRRQLEDVGLERPGDEDGDAEAERRDLLRRATRPTVRARPWTPSRR